MSVTSGFFNSLNGDRKYNAEQMSAIFDGIINDGVFANIGTAFGVTANGTDTELNVGIGRAWFNSAWVYNDAILPLTTEASEVVLNRYDAVVVEIDHSDAGRTGSIKVVTGTPATSPAYPTMIHAAYVNQYPLAYIYRSAGSTVITQADVTNMVGTSSCPYITGILETVDIDNLVAQWQGEWDVWSAQWSSWEAAWDQWFAEQTQNVDAETAAWLSQMQSSFDTWFESLQIILDGDVATNLGAAIIELQDRFKTLAEEKAIYEEIQDSEEDLLLDSNGNAIEGRTVMGGTDESQSGIGSITPELIGAAKEVHAEQHSTNGTDPIEPEMIGAAKEIHAQRHASTGADPITPAMIGAATVTKIRSIALNSASWSGTSQVVSVPGVVANEMAQKITVAPASASRAAYNDAGVQCTAQGNNTLTFTTDKKPSANLTVYVTIEEVTST